jgi:CRP/FNR family transcriptional regulator, cyclic AMP receptor protein
MDSSRYQPGQPLITEAELETLVKMIEERTGRPPRPITRGPGHTFFLEGEPGDFALLLQKGHVKVLSGRPARIIAVRDPGEIVGEMAVSRGKPRSASIVAWDEVVALPLPAETWVDFLYDHPRAMHAQWAAEADRTAQATSKIVESELAVGQQLAKEIVRLMDKGLAKTDGGAVTLELSQYDLASLIGTKKLDSVKKVIRQLKAEGIVSTSRQAIMLLDLAALRSIATGDLTV